MTSELRRRLLVTLAALAGAWVLRYVPFPGVNLMALGPFGHGMDDAFVFSRMLARASLGGQGITPYVSGSMLATLFLFLRSPGPATSDTRPVPAWIPNEPRLALVLSLVFAGGAAFGRAIWLENLTNSVDAHFVAHPGSMFRLTACVTSMAAMMLIIVLARLVSTRGIGNGALLLLGFENLGSTVNTFRGAAGGTTAWTMPLALVVCWIALATWWLGARWTLGEPAEAGAPADAASQEPATVPRFHVSGVGTAGLAYVVSFLHVPAFVAGFLPFGHPLRAWMARFTPDTPLYLVLLVLLGAGATYVITAWAYDAAIIRRALALWPSLAIRCGPLIEDEPYDRRLSRVAGLSALGVPFGCALFAFFARKAETRWLSAISLLALTAIVLDTSRQWRLHRSMALGARPGEHGTTCPRCNCPLSESDQHCAGCGVVIDGDPTCENHPHEPAAARCLVCQRALCHDCTRVVEDRAVCEAHAGVKLVEGWASLGERATELEAEVIQARLADRGIEAVVLANTWGPAFGTLGVFQVLPAVPLLAHSRCGGGGIQVLVRPTDWLAAIDACRDAPVETV